MTLGSVTYTVTDVIYEGGVLYGTVVMEPAEGENVVLMPEDSDVSEPAGYNIHCGEAAPEGAVFGYDEIPDAIRNGAQDFSCYNTTITVRGGSIVELIRRWIP